MCYGKLSLFEVFDPLWPWRDSRVVLETIECLDMKPCRKVKRSFTFQNVWIYVSQPDFIHRMFQIIAKTLRCFRSPLKTQHQNLGFKRSKFEMFKSNFWKQGKQIQVEEGSGGASPTPEMFIYQMWSFFISCEMGWLFVFLSTCLNVNT